jgi:hypothetical protein
MCSPFLAKLPCVGSSNVCPASTAVHHYHAFQRVVCSFCSLPANIHANLPPLPSGVLRSCSQHLRDIGVFINAGANTLGEASSAALALASVLPPTNVIVSTDSAAGDNDIDAAAAAATASAGVRFMLMPDDDDGSHVGGYGLNAPWKKAQSRFPHALSAAISHMPRNVKWIISQDSDTALNIPAIAVLLASHDSNDRVIFGCLYEHFRDKAKRAHLGGGAGMIFSIAAAQAVEEAWRSNLPHSAPM